jgi:UDPglucose 6-dehydrogenase
MQATKISFMNELANLAELFGADIERVRNSLGDKPAATALALTRGSCFPKDVQALVHAAQQARYLPELLQAVEGVNPFQKQRLRGHCFWRDGGTVAAYCSPTPRKPPPRVPMPW